MNIKLTGEGLGYMKRLLTRVAKTFKDSLWDPTEFIGKLAILDIKVKPEPCVPTRGSFWPPAIRGMPPRIILNVNDDNSSKYAAFIFAHELAHYWLYIPSDPLCLSGEAEDGSTNYTLIMRKKGDGSRFGLAFEELVCNYVAGFIVSKMNFKKQGTDDYDSYLDSMKAKFEILRKIEEHYGEPLYEREIIDECYYEKGKIITRNVFWTCITSGAFYRVINDYEEEAGSGAFEAFVENELKE